MSDPNYPPPPPPDPNAGWSTVHNPAASGEYPPQNQYPPAGAYPPGQYPPPQGQYPPPGAYPPPGYAQPQSGLSSTTASGLAYLTFIPAVIFLCIDPYKRDPQVRFHAWQEIALTLVWFAVRLVIHFVTLGGMFGQLLSGLVWLVFFACWLVAIIKAFNGQRWKIPGVGDLAENFLRSA